MKVSPIGQRRRPAGRSLRRGRWRKSQVIGLAVLAALVAVAVVVGVVVEGQQPIAAPVDESTPAVTTPTPGPSSEVPPAPETPAAGASTSVVPPVSESPVESEGREFTYGQPVIYQSTSPVSEAVLLEITVRSPELFEPSADATVFDHRAYGGAVPGDLHEQSVFFTVTIRNISDGESYDIDFLFSDVTDTGDDDRVSSVLDGDVAGLPNNGTLAPGQQVTFRDGYSFTSAAAVRYELKIDGLAGKSFYFTR